MMLVGFTALERSNMLQQHFDMSWVIACDLIDELDIFLRAPQLGQVQKGPGQCQFF